MSILVFKAFFVDSETWQVLDARYKWAPRVFGHFHGDQHGFYYIGGMRIDLKHVKKMNDVDYLDLNELQWSRRHRLEGVKEDLPHISAVVYEAEIVGCANARFSPTTFYDSDKMKLASPGAENLTFMMVALLGKVLVFPSARLNAVVGMPMNCIIIYYTNHITMCVIYNNSIYLLYICVK